MTTIRGGIVSTGNDVELTISISGGKNYKRVYNDIVSVALDKFVLISTTLHKLLMSKSSPSNVKFYVEQIEHLLQRAHVELIPGTLPFHQKYNMWLLDGYVRMLLETTDMKLITQLLDLDSILYSIEEAGIKQGNPTFLSFTIPKSIKVLAIDEIDASLEVATPVADELSAYLHSLDHNMMLLVKLIEHNRHCLVEIHKNIITMASKLLGVE
jgi:hypothetical protein